VIDGHGHIWKRHLSVNLKYIEPSEEKGKVPSSYQRPDKDLAIPDQRTEVTWSPSNSYYPPPTVMWS